MAEEIRDRAIVLGVVDYGESDRIVTLLGREEGKVSAFARGARASKKRFAGALSPFHLLSVRLVPRRGELFGLASCSVEETFLGLRESLEAIALAGYATELCRELCRDREPHPELFDRLEAYFSALARGAIRPEDRLAFELGALTEAGFAPRLDACVRCAGSAEGGNARFFPGQGGLLCGRCALTAGEGIALTPVALDLLRAAQSAPARVAEGAPSGGALRECRLALRTYLRHTLGKDLRSLSVLRQLSLE